MASFLYGEYNEMLQIEILRVLYKNILNANLRYSLCQIEIFYLGYQDNFRNLIPM